MTRPSPLPSVRSASNQRERGKQMGAFAGRFEHTEDTTRFPNGHRHVVRLAGAPVSLATFQPGWRWSNDVRPLVGTDRCPFHHVGYVLAGALHVESNDGTTKDLRAGDLYEIEPGHDAWVAGDESCVLLDWGRHVRESTQPVALTTGGSR